MADEIVQLSSKLNLNLLNRMPIAILPSQDIELAGLNVGTRFTGVIIASKIKGIQQLKTTFGVLLLQTRFPIKINDLIELQLIQKGRQLQFLITKINQKSPPNILTQDYPKASVDSKFHKNKSESLLPRAQSQSESKFTKPLTNGMKTSITFLQKVTLDPTRVSGNNKAQSLNQFKISQTEKSPSISINNAHSSISLTQKITGINAKNTTSSNQLAVNEVLNKKDKDTLFNSTQLFTHSTTNQKNSGRQFNVIIKSIVPVPKLSLAGGLPPSGSGDLTIGKTITGVVIGQKGPSISVMQSHAGPIAIHNSSYIPAGTTITFQVLTELTDKANPELDLIKNKFGLIIQETKEWKNLTDVIQLISIANPAIGQQALNTAIPRLDIALASKIIFFIAALQGSDIRKLFGDAPIRILQRTNPNLLSQLSEDFKQIARLSDERNENEWRAFPIPIINNEKIEQIRLFLKSAKKQNTTSSDAEIRFIVDADLTQIGRFQLDGLFNSEKKIFDLIIRTELELTKNIEKTIKSIFDQVTKISKTDGQVKFKSSPDGFLNVNQDHNNTSNQGLVI